MLQNVLDNLFEVEVAVYLTVVAEEEPNDADLARYVSKKIRAGDYDCSASSIELDKDKLSYETLNSPVFGYEGREEWLVSDWINYLT